MREMNSAPTGGPKSVIHDTHPSYVLRERHD